MVTFQLPSCCCWYLNVVNLNHQLYLADAFGIKNRKKIMQFQWKIRETIIIIVANLILETCRPSFLLYLFIQLTTFFLSFLPISFFSSRHFFMLFSPFHPFIALYSLYTHCFINLFYRVLWSTCRQKNLNFLACMIARIIWMLLIDHKFDTVLTDVNVGSVLHCPC